MKTEEVQIGKKYDHYIAGFVTLKNSSINDVSLVHVIRKGDSPNTFFVMDYTCGYPHQVWASNLFENKDEKY